MKYKCPVCGYIYDEEKEGKPLSELGKCPIQSDTWQQSRN